MNPRKYENNAARQKAYRERKKLINRNEWRKTTVTESKLRRVSPVAILQHISAEDVPKILGVLLEYYLLNHPDAQSDRDFLTWVGSFFIASL
jgi:hypothetical protein